MAPTPEGKSFGELAEELTEAHTELVAKQAAETSANRLHIQATAARANAESVFNKARQALEAAYPTRSQLKCHVFVEGQGRCELGVHTEEIAHQPHREIPSWAAQRDG